MSGATRQLNVRVPENLIEELEKIAAEEQADRASIVRRLLAEGLQRWRLEQALQMYRRGQITKERAAELAGVSIYDIMDELRQRGTVAQYTLGELCEDLAFLRQSGPDQ